jgi:hypothetical protein
MFSAIADFLVCGEIESHPVEVSTTCFETTLCTCGDGGQTLCNDPYPTPNDPLCYKSTLLEMEINAPATARLHLVVTPTFQDPVLYQKHV